ncbi:MAG: NFACT family protein [Clostridium sp.]|jgi:predicted ribosome quality control (RQC) complex YloA/Tae2 family protein|nr:NFACT family protein [Clostridium sp.]
MPLDGVTLHFLRAELSAATGARVEKIHQPERHSIVLSLKGRDFSGRLLLCARPDAPRVQFTTAQRENPQSPPMFCMLLRKHLGSARLNSLRQEGLDRVLYLDFAATDELGDSVKLTLCAELIPGMPNIILLKDGRVLDAIRRVYPEMEANGKAARTVLPGAEYSPPPCPQKLNLLRDEAPATINEPLNQLAQGVSPLIARELEALPQPAVTLRKSLLEGEYSPCLLRDTGGTPKDFSCFEITQYAGLYNTENYPSLSALLEAFYAERDRTEGLRIAGDGLRKTLEGLLARTRRRVESQQADLSKAAGREEYRRNGDLILAQQYKLQPGSAFYELEDYENGGRELRLAVSPQLTPAANAQMFYKKYQKARRAEEKLREQIAAGLTDAEYLEAALDSLDRAAGAGEIAALREELTEEGFLRRNNKQKRKDKGKKPNGRVSLCAEEYSGFTILIGKTAAQNELIAFKEARRGDLWLHVQKAPGAHVLIRAEGRKIPPQVIEHAAELAVANSTQRAAAKASVDIVEAKKLKKPAGGRPGMVIYHEYESILAAGKQ